MAGQTRSVANCYASANGQFTTEHPQRNVTITTPLCPSVSESIPGVVLGVTIFCIIPLPRVTLRMTVKKVKLLLFIKILLTIDFQSKADNPQTWYTDAIFCSAARSPPCTSVILELHMSGGAGNSWPALHMAAYPEWLKWTCRYCSCSETAVYVCRRRGGRMRFRGFLLFLDLDMMT